ncbi:hypothetical protein V495_00656 [Pseudogymnoascus sp. VKM F-4514 (FW-929)]|nr:hypothetical protein V490_06376 [Pseudogymnoascus sp. VKM F-3557]KFY49190.1 hypothetical protein V495_00656 [Pseudogymnoascus sp. VKM F-4514 (FW-929)]KFY62218.1 hypothetical protein V497_02508 [Pseudogymnoascus sp. VKM F-4516 (FW-969)]
METTPRRSSRLKKLEAIRAEKAKLLGQEAPQLRKANNRRQSRSNKSRSSLLDLPSEVRLLIFSDLVTTARPFMIGRVQESRRKTYGSPRDITSFRPKQYKVRRDDSRNRPKQPPITRVCRIFREEALPLWYSRNRFWLIHNEFQPDDDEPSTYRRFDDWISQTPRGMFDFMEHISLCGYATWPNRIMVTLDLKNRRLVSIRRYSTYGDELPIYQEERIESTRQTLASKADEDGLAALQAVIAEWDDIFRISQEYYTSPPGMKTIEPASGWEYDW